MTTKTKPGKFKGAGKMRKQVQRSRIAVVGDVNTDTGEVKEPLPAGRGSHKAPAREMCKVKFSPGGGKVHLEYKHDYGSGGGRGEPDEFLLKCGDAPLPSFVAAFVALIPHAARWLELDPKSGMAARLTVSGLSVSYAHGVMGASLTCRVPLVNCQGPLIINCPHKPSEPYGEGGDESVCMPGDTVEAVRTLIDEAWKYVDGERAQGRLFADADEDDGEDGTL